jgi:hypothetical protein
MGCPSQGCGDDDTENRVVCDAVEQGPHALRLFRRGKGVQQNVKRQQHQPEADRHAAKILDAGAWSSAECQQADDEQYRCGRRDVEREKLDDERRSNIRTKHDREGGNQRHESL